jgi:Tfp pilus assembly protein PilX
MKSFAKQFSHSQKQQRGMSLITSLIFLGVLTTLGYSSINTAFMQERMSGAWQDRKMANEAAEMALRDAEAFLSDTTQVNGLTGFNRDCTGGLCYNGPQGYAVNIPNGLASDVWKTNGIFANADKSISYGVKTGAAVITGVIEQPTYVIEGFRKQTSGQSESIYYRITVRAVGAHPGTTVTLQEIYRA